MSDAPISASAVKTLHQELEGYIQASYGDRPLSPTQFHEVRQAFMAGAVVALNRVAEISRHSDDDALVALVKLFDEVEHEARPR